LDEWRQPRPDMLTQAGLMRQAREYLDRDAIVLSDAGHTQDHLWRTFPVYGPRCHISSGGFSTMGFSVPAAIGCKIAAPDRQVVGIIGDGSFLMTCQELATVAHYGLQIVYIVCNNHGWACIRDMQREWYGDKGVFSTEFFKEETPEESSNPDFQMLGEAFGLYAERVERVEDVKPALDRAFRSGRPALLEAVVESQPPYSMLPITGWADYPTPEYIDSKMNK